MKPDLIPATTTATSDPHDWLTRYRPWQHIIEPGFWIVLFCTQATINSIVVLMDIERVHLDFAVWEPVVWEWSSHLVLLAMVPAVIAFERVLPLQLGTWRQNLGWHVLATVPYCIIHVVAIVALRKVSYSAMGSEYVFGNWPRELAYEYLKDFRSYASILITVAFYRLLLLRLQGEARLLDAPDTGPPVEAIEHPERFLVRKLGKDFLLPAAEVEWLQAWGNYVNLRVRARDYPLRSTMAAIETRLDPGRFVRVHRSYIVNLDCVLEIEPLESGDARAKMRDGSHVPVSRRYRDELRKRAS